jgi:hypothetical protein
MRLFLSSCVAIAMAFALLLVGAYAVKAASCGPAAAIASGLNDRAGEWVTLQGVSADNGLVRIYVHPSKRTWTIVTVTPDGQVGCIVSAGDGMEWGKKVTPGKAM